MCDVVVNKVTHDISKSVDFVKGRLKIGFVLANLLFVPVYLRLLSKFSL